MPAYSQYEDPLYVSVPFFIGIHDSTVYGIFLDNSTRTRFDFGASTDNQFSSFTVPDGKIDPRAAAEPEGQIEPVAPGWGMAGHFA